MWDDDKGREVSYTIVVVQAKNDSGLDHDSSNADGRECLDSG